MTSAPARAPIGMKRNDTSVEPEWSPKEMDALKRLQDESMRGLHTIN